MGFFNVEVKEGGTAECLQSHEARNEGFDCTQELDLGLIRVLEVAQRKGVLSQVHEGHDDQEYHHVEDDVSLQDAGHDQFGYLGECKQDQED